MFMPDAEILASYNRADNKVAQIRVLAELNAVSQKEMREKLEVMGADLPKRKKTPAASAQRMDEERFMCLYDQGFSDGEIAKNLGVSETTTRKFRSDLGLIPNAKKRQVRKSPTPPAEEMAASETVLPQAMTVTRLMQLLSVVEAAHPDALVFTQGQSISGMRVSMFIAPDGKTKSAHIELRTEGASA